MRLGAIYTFMKKYHTYLMRHRQDYLYTKKILGPETCFHLHVAIHVTHLSIVVKSLHWKILTLDSSCLFQMELGTNLFIEEAEINSLTNSSKTFQNGC